MDVLQRPFLPTPGQQQAAQIMGNLDKVFEVVTSFRSQALSAHRSSVYTIGCSLRNDNKSHVQHVQSDRSLPQGGMNALLSAKSACTCRGELPPTNSAIVDSTLCRFSFLTLNVDNNDSATSSLM